jgi:hypothetical protein
MHVVDYIYNLCTCTDVDIVPVHVDSRHDRKQIHVNYRIHYANHVGKIPLISTGWFVVKEKYYTMADKPD